MMFKDYRKQIKKLQNRRLPWSRFVGFLLVLQSCGSPEPAEQIKGETLSVQDKADVKHGTFTSNERASLKVELVANKTDLAEINKDPSKARAFDLCMIQLNDDFSCAETRKKCLAVKDLKVRQYICVQYVKGLGEGSIIWLEVAEAKCKALGYKSTYLIDFGVTGCDCTGSLDNPSCKAKFGYDGDDCVLQ
jgi:hypothetical protein